MSLDWMRSYLNWLKVIKFRGWQAWGGHWDFQDNARLFQDKACRHLSFLWSHPADGFEHEKLEEWQIKTNEFEIDEIIVEEGIDLGFRIKDSLLPNMVL